MQTGNKLNIVKVLNRNKVELVNFNNVAKINIQYKDRIILNFNHTITRNINNSENSTGTSTGTFAGYYYIDKASVDNYQEIRDMLFSEKFENNFANIKSNSVITGFVNVNEISTIKVSDHNLSVIFNMSHSVTSLKRPNSSLLHSADSVISSFDHRNDFDDFVENFIELYTL